MRTNPHRTAALLLVALLTTVSTTLALVPANAEEPAPSASLPAQASPQAVLATAEQVLEGEAAAGDPEPTMALLELRHALDGLSGVDLQRAHTLLARPEGVGSMTLRADEPSSGRTARRAAICDADLCVRYVRNPGSPDYATDAWAQHTFEVLQQVWGTAVDEMGYRAPLQDGTRGGDGRFDVYLRDIGQDYYGYCNADSGAKRTSGHCVLDNDYQDFEFGDPDGSLRATAAHEFFHVVQYAYDSYEDPWFMEASATWMEEQVFDEVDDNHQYLRSSQIHQAHVPLDTFGHSLQYGNWVYLEHLTTRFGDPLVRRAWQLAGARSYSLTALRKALAEQGAGFAPTYARFAGANTHPATAYPEGAAYGRPRPDRRVRLSAGSRRASGVVRIDHLAARTWRVLPDSALTRPAWRLRVAVDGPGRRAAPQLAVTVLRPDGTTAARVVKLNRRGRGSTVVPFSSRRVKDVSVTPVNASTRYRCWRGTSYACAGVSRDDGRRFTLRLRAFRR